MKKYSTCTVQYHVQCQGMTEQYKSCFPSKRCICNEKTCYCHTFYDENHTYVPVIRKFYLLKSILAYCGYSPTSPVFFWFSGHKHCDNAATNFNSGNARSRMVTSLWEAWLRGQRKMSQVLGAFGLLDFTMLRLVLAWRV